MAVELKADNGAIIDINGHLGGEKVETATNTYTDGKGITAHEVWLEHLRFQERCENDKKAMRKEFNDKVEKIEESVKNMRNVTTSVIGLLIVVFGSIAYSLYQPSVDKGYTVDAEVQALSQHDMYELSKQGNPTPPDFTMPAIPKSGDVDEEHCAQLAVAEDELSNLEEPVCFPSFNDALAYIAEQTGYEADDIRLLIERQKEDGASEEYLEQYQAVIGAWFSQSGYNGSTTVVYSKNGNGCYDGSIWNVPVINQYIGSALKMGGCWTNTIHSEYYFHPSSAVQWCNCPSVGLSRVRSARYSP